MSKIEFTPEFLKKIQQLSIQLRRSTVGSQGGIHKSIRKGHGLEFSDLRPYSPGDDFRSIDWNALARTDKIYTKQYREEQDIKILVVNDYSKSLAPFDLATNLALTLCYIGLCSGDKVSLLLPEIDQFPWVNSLSVFKSMVEFMEKQEPSKEVNLGHSIIKATSNLKVPARLFIVSDFLYPIAQVEQALEYATSKNFEVSLLIINSISNDQFPEDTIFVDSETDMEFSLEVSINKVQENLDKHLGQIIEIVRHYGQQYLILKHTDSLDDVVFKNLIGSGMLR